MFPRVLLALLLLVAALVAVSAGRLSGHSIQKQRTGYSRVRGLERELKGKGTDEPTSSPTESVEERVDTDEESKPKKGKSTDEPTPTPTDELEERLDTDEEPKPKKGKGDEDEPTEEPTSSPTEELEERLDTDEESQPKKGKGSDDSEELLSDEGFLAAEANLTEFNDIAGRFEDEEDVSEPKKGKGKGKGKTSDDLEDRFSDGFGIEANVTEELGDIDERIEDAANTSFIFIKPTGDASMCITFNTTVGIADCDASGEAALWEIVESADPTLFQLRHAASELCLPENPESPDEAFTCWIDEDNAIADTINGLVDCESEFAAFLGFIDAANPSLLYNAICSTGDIGSESDVVLMAYDNKESGAAELLWGEKVLLDLASSGAPFDLEGGWFFEEA